VSTSRDIVLYMAVAVPLFPIPPSPNILLWNRLQYVVKRGAGTTRAGSPISFNRLRT
jgi:hypothetical protein